MKNIIEEKIFLFRDYDFDTLTLLSFKNIIESLIEKYGEKAIMENDSYENVNYVILHNREETDIEYQSRINKENKKKEAALEKKRAQYLKLQKELGLDNAC
ncbi:MAG: hypothetical protein WC055_00775 [Melioribacteraceae bacterium]